MGATEELLKHKKQEYRYRAVLKITVNNFVDNKNVTVFHFRIKSIFFAGIKITNYVKQKTTESWIL